MFLVNLIMLDASGTGYLDAPSHILKEKCFSLIKHDFNEPQKGKDQCDRESAVAQHCRTVYQWKVSVEDIIKSVEDIKNSLLYINGVKNAKVSIAGIDSSVNEIKTQKIDISNFHSAEFEDNKICLWNYFSVGKGTVIEKKPAEFTPCLNVVSRFDKASSYYNSTPCEHKKTPDLIK